MACKRSRVRISYSPQKKAVAILASFTTRYIGVVDVFFYVFPHRVRGILCKIGQKNGLLSGEMLSKSIIDLPDRPDGQPEARRCNLAKDCFLLSFGLIGMNSADLYSSEKINRSLLIYNRQKTCTRRAGRAEMKV